MEARGTLAGMEQAAALRAELGLDKPLWFRYLRWSANFIQGNFGWSFAYSKRVSDLVGERLPFTILLTLATFLFATAVSIPIGVYSAVKKYSLGDYVATLMGFIGLAVPEFLLALVLMYIGYSVFGAKMGGLFSAAYVDAAWSLAKVADMLQHLWVPVVVIGLHGTAGTIRVLRSTTLDELEKPYVLAAEARGLSERQVLVKHILRVALNPYMSTVGWLLPGFISGETIASVVLGLPTNGPLILNALLTEDMYLAGSFIMFSGILTVTGTLISDILLAWLDPRIRIS
jgi:peptide/nickel transport system permease protein